MGFAAVTAGKFCRVVNKKGYALPKVKCAKADGSAKEAAICSCGTDAVEVAVDSFCYELATGAGKKVDAACAKTDASVKEAAKCSCNAPDQVSAVAVNEFCLVANKKGYKLPKVKCAKADGSAKEAAICSCGTDAVEVAVDSFCYELATGAGKKVDAACAKTDASVKEAAKCSCNAPDQVSAVAVNEFCLVANKKGYKLPKVKCAKAD